MGEEQEKKKFHSFNRIAMLLLLLLLLGGEKVILEVDSSGLKIWLNLKKKLVFFFKKKKVKAMEEEKKQQSKSAEKSNTISSFVVGRRMHKRFIIDGIEKQDLKQQSGPLRIKKIRKCKKKKNKYLITLTTSRRAKEV